MDFSAKRLTLLAGVGDVEDRHEIVREYAQQLNESSEARQMNENEEEVRKAVRRTIQKMISEGAINLQEDSIARELEHLRANIQADHDHVASLLDDIRDDRDEEHRAEEHRDEMREDEMHHLSEEGDISRDLEDKGEWEEDELQKEEDELDNPKLDDDSLEEADLIKMPDRGTVRIDPALLRKHLSAKQLEDLGIEKEKDLGIQGVETPPEDDDLQKKSLEESDATFMRLQKLAGVQILTEGKEEDLEEDFPGPGQIAATDAMEDPETDADQVPEVDEAKLYEMEDGRLYMELGGKKFMVQEMEEELDELNVELDDEVAQDLVRKGLAS